MMIISFDNHLLNEEDLVNTHEIVFFGSLEILFLGWGKRNAIFVDEHPDTIDEHSSARIWFDDK